MAGLDPEDIALLLNQQNSVDQIRGGTVRDLMDRVVAREAIKRQAAAAAAKRQQELEDIQSTRTFEIGKLAAQSQLRKSEADYDAALATRDPLKIAQAEASRASAKRDLAAIDSPEMKKAKLEAEQALAMQRRAEARAKETGAPDMKDLLAADERLTEEADVIMNSSYIDSKGRKIDVPIENRIAAARQANNRPNSPVFWKFVPGEEVPLNTPGNRLGRDVEASFVPLQLPRNPKTGKQITSQEIIDTAAANNMEPEELLRLWGILE